ncbi:flagellin-like protein [Natronospirillum operosum]|uniref:Flagellin n=1 Tax=Natronospirillum operosum TaxID=2759953 RepID=A0A4Z0WCD3_9GAMM|nr:flagellin [Natronospirillum operosum]TGG93573.1 flagellin-like protein [Natronospirillum operosum]
MNIQSPVTIGSSTGSNFTDLVRQGSSGQRINSAADDAAGLAITSRLTTRVEGTSVAERNIGDGLSLLQTRSGLASTVTEQVQRMREISVQAGNGIYSAQDREALNREFMALRDTVGQTLDDAQFNGRPLFAGGTVPLQTGPDAGQITELADNDLPARLEASGFTELSLASPTADTLGTLDEALSLLAESQVADGASANRLLSQADALAQSRIDAAQTRSRIADKDFAELASELAQTDVRDRARVLMQSQANAKGEDVLRLLTG